MTYQKVARGIAWVSVSSIAQIVASALSIPILAQVLGPEEFGQYAYYQAILLLAAPLANLGATQMMTRYIAEHPEDLGRRASIVKLGALFITIGICSIIAIAGIALSPGINTPIIVTSLLFALVAEQAMLFSRGVLYGVHQEARVNIPMALASALSSIAAIGMAIAGYGLPGVLSGIAIANSLMAVVALINARAFIPVGSINHSQAPIQTTSLIRFGLLSALLSALGLAMYRLDQLLVQSLAGSLQAGLYAAAAKGAEAIWFIPIAIQSVMLQSTTAYWANNQHQTITALLSRLVRYLILAICPVLLVLGVFADVILKTYFGQDYLAATPAIRIMIPGVFCLSIARLLMPTIQARGNLKSLIAMMLGTTVLNIILNLWLTPQMGATGTAIAASASYIAATLICLGLMGRYGVQPLAALSPVRLALLSIVTVAIISPIRIFITNPVISVLMGGSIAMIVFSIGALRLNLIHTSELYSLSNYIPSPFNKPVVELLHYLEPLLLRIGTKSTPL